MPTPLAFRTVAALAIAAFLAGCLAAAAHAQAPAPTTVARTLVASGTGTVAVTPGDRDDNASIVKAVDAASTKALPLAIKDARAQAAQLAAAAAVTLGPLVSLSNEAPVNGPFFGPLYPITGTFGPGKFCGTIRTRSSKIGQDGKRHYGPLRSKRTCRVPSTVQRSVELTFALA